jgi:hypothetical protein
MATRKKAEPQDVKQEQEKPKEAAGGDILQKAAKAIGSALGTAAVKTGIATPPRKKIGKLVKKTRARLPRKEKKQAKKKLLNSAP